MWVLLVIFALPELSSAFVSPGASAETTSASEEQVRAAFLFQLAQYVSWPAEALGTDDSALRFCVLGQDRLVSTLEPTVRGKSIHGRAISVSRVTETVQLSGCHLAFIGLNTEKQIRGALAAWSYPPVLLVGEASRFAEFGGMVNLVIESGRVSFEINLGATGRAHLELRSQLLRFARIVPGGNGERR